MELIKDSFPMKQSAELCMICLEDLEDDTIKLKPQLCVTSETCNCNVTIHTNCNDMMNRMGLYCPICRIRVDDIIPMDTARLIFWLTSLFILILVII